MSEVPKQLAFKFVLVGDSAVGKTSICNNFCQKPFNNHQEQTIGLEFGTRCIDIESTKIKLQIWDTAGQEKFRSMTRAYFRASTAVFLVFDLTSRDTFAHINEWTEEAMKLSPVNAVKVLVGNKADLVAERAVSTAEAEDFAKQNNLNYFETSALSGEKIDDTFIEIAHIAFTRFVDGKLDVPATKEKEREEGRVDVSKPERENKSCC